MKVLLDECMPLRFRHVSRDHVAHTAQWAGFKGLTNGALLDPAEQAGYDVLVTVDQGIRHQQLLITRRLAIIVVRSRTNQLENLVRHSTEILNALQTLRPGQMDMVGESA